MLSRRGGIIFLQKRGILLIKKIQEFLLAFGHFNIDYLSGKINGMSVYQDSFCPCVSKYFGGGLYRYSFFVEITSPYAADLNADSHLIVDEFIDFIERMNLKRRLPELDGGLKSQRIEVVENIGRLKATPNTARYRLKLELLYTKE